MFLEDGEITLFNVKPAVGFTLPSAGVTPAPGVNRKVVRGALLCSRVIFHDPRAKWGRETRVEPRNPHLPAALRPAASPVNERARYFGEEIVEDLCFGGLWGRLRGHHFGLCFV